MGVYLSGSYNRLSLSGIRRLLANPPKRLDLRRVRASVEFSPLAHGLRELERIQIAAEGCCSSSVGLPAPSAALNRGVSSVDTPSPLLPTGDTPPTHRNERRSN